MLIMTGEGDFGFDVFYRLDRSFMALCSSSMLFSGGRPTQARRMFSIQARCLERELMTGVAGGTKGALKR